MSDAILELKNISKSFPGVKALDGVHFDLRLGEVHCLLGENGAGKSTLIKIITGVHHPDTGKLILDREEVTFRSPLDAQNYGIAAIYQHVTAYPHLTVAENIFMGHEKITKYLGRLDWKTMHAEAQSILDQLDANFDSHETMSSLSVARRQIVEIAKALSTNARIVIMDEPTASLTHHESEELYRITKRLRDSGVGVIFISHRMEDMWRLADRVTVFRDGRRIGCWDREDLRQDTLIVAMVGREISQMYPKRAVHLGEELLRVENLTRIGFFRDVSFDVRQGEIVALTGLVGAGRTEVCESIYGVYPADSGRIYLQGERIDPRTPKEALALGIGHLPEDRQSEGLVLEWDIARNITLPSLHKFTRMGWLHEDEEHKVAGQLARRLNVKAKTVFTKVSALSGGNQQKVIVAKILTRTLKLIILDEPTKGIDVGAKVAICELIGEFAEQGYGILLVSSEMPEVLGMSDRVVVMKEGLVTGRFRTAETSQEELLNAAMVVETPKASAAIGGGEE